MIKKFFATKSNPREVDLVLLMFRIAVGYAFIRYGWGKIQNPMDWMGPNTAMPGIMQALAALSEFGGGIAIVLGLFTRLASIGIAFTMIGAVNMHMFILGHPYVNTAGGGSYVLPTTFLLVALLLITAGPGRYSVDKKIF